MNKYFIIIFLFLSVLSYSALEKIPFDKWPQFTIKNMRILIAEGNLAHQGFAGAKAKDFKNTFIFFPGIKKGIEFVNYDQGYGPVIKTLAVIFMNNKWEILKISIMKKQTGTAITPSKTSCVFECLPSIARKLKFKAGKPSPIVLSDSQLSGLH
ncbi:MAG: hypothetical protein M1135_02595 [Candidatus Omnitrophica bacterium]|jgi:hypothetical protein|nr:hypothetical protein [Candidatus Omnitrophota bacterium]